MAILQKMRGSAGIVMVIIMALVLLAFIISDLANRF